MAEQIAYDQTGIAWVQPHGGSLAYLSQAQMSSLNDPLATSTIMTLPEDFQSYVGVVFGEPMDITGYVLSGRRQYVSYTLGTLTIHTSTDTTNGQDGTWTSQGTGTPYELEEKGPEIALVVSDVKGIRFTQTGPSAWNFYLQDLYLYGDRATASNTNIIEFWHPTNDVVLPADWLDNYNMYRNGTFTKQFRLKNLSAASTANNITLSTDVLTDAAEPLGPEQEFDDGGTPANPLNIGNLAAGAISSVITYTVTKGATASLEAWSPRIKIQPGSWS